MKLWMLTVLPDDNRGCFWAPGLITLEIREAVISLLSDPYWLLLPTSLQDLEGKIIVDELRQEVITSNSKAEPPQCNCLAWSADGQVRLSFATS